MKTHLKTEKPCGKPMETLCDTSHTQQNVGLDVLAEFINLKHFK